ncbi:S-formylglutathione hydrolase FrmB [Streptomyces sp. 1114.5]|uniref:alpha/beta hydrolase n=1 Tax=Streptomyces sp. 1114.5 TaxID=1938830 RepID=UPI000EB37115|nr:alpha/beta hydrolase-fold protein [Streptomyces sp. 1114.5]RKT20183.1 S-formylglutathione hydrolase FrmB [Streptomyces sp. 1114.5]
MTPARLLPARPRRAARTAVAALAAGLLLLAVPATGAAATPSSVPAAATAAGAEPAEPAGPPPLTDGFGLTQVGTATGSATNFVITVTTPQVAGRHTIRILLPADYAQHPQRRYPVLYFLHGASDNPSDAALAYPALTAAQSMITVIPDGGLRGWYTDWLDQGSAAGAQNWETFHLGQVLPFVEANLRTRTDRAHRAVGGLSMGGFGALHYAQDRPELFGQVLSMSGANDLSTDEMIMRGAVVATLTNVGTVLCGPSDGHPCGYDFGPTVSSDAVFGTPYPVFNADWRWNAADPASRLGLLAHTGIALYTGNGNGNPADMEFWVEGTAKRVKDRLDALHLPYHYVDYGDGTGWGADCHGGHTAGCWAQDLVDYVPRLEAAFAAAP